MATHTLSVLKPSVNNLTVRIFVRAAGLEYEEIDVWGKKGTPEFLAKNPADLTPLLEADGLERGCMWESCAIMQYLCNKHGLDRFYPTDPARRAMVDSAMFYMVGTMYPLVGRATYPTLGFPQYPGEVGSSEADDELKAQAQREAVAALAVPLEAYNKFFLADQPFIGGDHPSIADIRLSATLEFLHAIDYPLPAWATEFMGAMETALGDAYTEPAADPDLPPRKHPRRDRMRQDHSVDPRAARLPASDRHRHRHAARLLRSWSKERHLRQRYRERSTVHFDQPEVHLPRGARSGECHGGRRLPGQRSRARFALVVFSLEQRAG